MKYTTVFLVCLAAGGAGLFGQEYVNELSPEEEKAGYDLLWNGENLDDFHGYRGEPIETNKWKVHTDEPLGPRIEVDRGWKPILTNKTYTNMDLKMEYLTPPATNSGIFVRYEEEASSAWNTRSGPEWQICSPGEEDCTKPVTSNGACYDMFPVKEELRDTWFLVDGWNEVRIVFYDSNYVHYGNGKKLLEYKIGTPEFMDAYKRSKYSYDGNGGNYYDIHPGSILLQNHGERVIVAFRNMRGKELKVNPFRQEFPDGQWPDELTHDFIFGKRGCTDSTSPDFDPEAEVDDGSCGTTETAHPGKFETVKVSSYKAADGMYHIYISEEHSHFSMITVAGKDVGHLRADDNSYFIDTNGKTGVYIITFRLDGVPGSKLIHMQ